MPSISRFRKRAVDIARGIEINSALVIKDVALRVVRTVSEVTPVDTGLAQGNWLVAVGTVPDLSTRPPRSPAEVMDEAGADLLQVRADSDVTIANGGEKVPYLDKLDKGSSSQAPRGFVANAVAAGLAVAAEARILRPRNGRGRRLA